MSRHGYYRRPACLGLLAMVLSGGCYVLPTTVPPAGPAAARAAQQPEVNAPAQPACSPVNLCQPAAVADSDEENRAAVDEAARSRAELQRLKQEILNLRERIGKAEKENLETIRSIVDALDQVLEQDKAREPREERADSEQPPAPDQKPGEIPMLPELPPIKRNGD